MDDNDHNAVDLRASAAAKAFGSLLRRRRQSLKMRQDQVALATGVGRRFLIDLEHGKPSCHLGRSLLVAELLGLKLPGLLPSTNARRPTADQPELPELPDEVEEADGQPARVL
jgi:transcriptional regulator with XRE-family HTH domain